MKSLFRYILLVLITAVTISSCGKDGSPTPTPPTPPTTPPPSVVVTCLLSGISQVNSGAKAEYALTNVYDADYNIKQVKVFDSTANKENYVATFNYITADSIRMNSYEYLRLDANKRVIVYVTKSDLGNPLTADNYRYEYTYNGDGYLAVKNLYINRSRLANFSTTYSYTNNQLTSCQVVSVSSGNLKVLDATLTYDNSITTKNWMYTFPDAMLEFKISSALNFGNRNSNPVKQIITRIYNPGSGALADTWTTNYSGYKVDATGNVVYGIASGDLQQGIASFYGKTNFYYSCHK